MGSGTEEEEVASAHFILRSLPDEVQIYFIFLYQIITYLMLSALPSP